MTQPSGGVSPFPPGQVPTYYEPKPATPPPPAPVRNVYISFQGVGFASGYRWPPFDLVCGPNPPTITAGYARWNKVKRYLQRSLTIMDGYDPAQMTLDVIFGQWANGWQQDDGTGQLISQQIAGLEWMAGAQSTAGPSPIVYVTTYSNQGGQTELIPKQYRGLPWIIDGGIKWGKAYRNPSGYRIWQEATIVLEDYLNLTKAPPADYQTAGGYFVTSPGRNTALLIAGAWSSFSPTVDHQTLARRILAHPKNNPIKGTSIWLQRKSVNWHIPLKKQVWVPGHTID